MARFFELRFGNELHNAGIAVEHEVPGEGASTLDFGFTSRGQSWKVEMMRLLETQAAKAATTTEVDNNGVRWVKQISSSGNEDKKQSPEAKHSRLSSASVRNASKVESLTSFRAGWCSSCHSV